VASALDKPLWTGLAFGVVHALLFGSAFPPLNIWPAAFLAPLPLVWAAFVTKRPLRSALGVSLASAPMWGLHHLWIWDVSYAGMPALVIYLSLWPGLFVWICARLARRVRHPALLGFGVPVVWTGLEVLRGEVIWHGYPWFLLGHPLIGTPLDRIASGFGVYSVSFLAALPAIGLAWRLGRVSASAASRQRRLWGVVCGVFVLLCFFLPWSLPKLESAAADTRRARIAVVQTNLPSSNKIDMSNAQRLDMMRRLMVLSEEAAAGAPEWNGPPDVIVWPETSVPSLFALNPEAVAVERAADLNFKLEDSETQYATTVFHDSLVELQQRIGVPMVVGAIAANGLRIDLDDDGKVKNIHVDALFNSAFLVEHGAVHPQRYDKMHLTPFGEIMPYISQWDWLERQLLALGARGMQFDLEPGRQPVRMSITPADPVRAAGPSQPLAEAAAESSPSVPPVRAATPICFEATMSDVCRRLVFEGGRRQADLLLNLTNDGWFGRSVAAREHHLLIARWRCIELGTPMIRAANTGISCAIDRQGRVVAKGPQKAGHSSGSGRHGEGGRFAYGQGANVEGVLFVEVALPASGPDASEPVFRRAGNVAGWAMLTLTAGIVVWSMVPRVGVKPHPEPMNSSRDHPPGTPSP